MKSALAVVALAAFCATATAAPIGSPSHSPEFSIFAPLEVNDLATETLATEIKDAGLTGPIVYGRSFRLTDEPEAPDSQFPLAATAISGSALLAFSTVFALSRRSLRHRSPHWRRVRRVYRTMSPI